MTAKVFFMVVLEALANTLDPWKVIAVVSSLLAVISGFIVAVIGIIQWRGVTLKRASDFRWKQAELARMLMDEWFDWEYSQIALILVDEGADSYGLKNGVSFDLDPERDVPMALAFIDNHSRKMLNHSPKDKFVRRCFDELFYYFERAEHSVQLGVACIEDFEASGAWYVGCLAVYRQDIDIYLPRIGYNKAHAFLRRFPVWETSGSRTVLCNT
jgi:hypothetical protein